MIDYDWLLKYLVLIIIMIVATGIKNTSLSNAIISTTMFLILVLLSREIIIL